MTENNCNLVILCPCLIVSTNAFKCNLLTKCNKKLQASPTVFLTNQPNYVCREFLFVFAYLFFNQIWQHVFSDLALSGGSHVE